MTEGSVPHVSTLAARSPRDGWTARHQQVAQDAGYSSWEAWCAQVAADRGHQICGALVRSQQRPCRNAVVGEVGRCRMHGGKSKVGPEHHKFVHGQRSEYYLPGQLGRDFEAALNDPSLIELRRQLALAEAREGELVRALSDADAAGNWAEAWRAFIAVEDALAADDAERLPEAVHALRKALEGGIPHETLWARIRENAEHKRRLSETERRRLETLSQFITSERAMAQMALVTESIQRHVNDPHTLAAIAAEIRQHAMIGTGPSREIVAEAG